MLAFVAACAKAPTPLPSAPAASASVTTASVTSTVSAVASVAPPAVACLPRYVAGEGLVHVEATSDRAVFCYGAESAREASCLEVELATGAVVATRTHAITPPARGVVDPKGVAAINADGTPRASSALVDPRVHLGRERVLGEVRRKERSPR
jgi:hypothetical protein